ncbi:signal peptidase I [Vagococcus humatus]|uniref:Signal peptidase I n=2 Tax=Vagococcus humatus TaxID=1889241 RepID=A0A3S0AY01_9ENTE|nr:signal peptidase I [Vagococcus humatus]
MRMLNLYTKKEWLLLVLFVLFMLLIRFFCFSPIKVQGISMEPNLKSNQRLWSVKLKQVHRFDIIQLRSPLNVKEHYVKRIIGLPGEEVAYEKNQLYINQSPIKEPFLNKQAVLTDNYSLYESLGIKKIPKDFYLVLGDNRQHSYDGRTFGLVKIDQIEGVVLFRYWPFQQLGRL